MSDSAVVALDCRPGLGESEEYREVEGVIGPPCDIWNPRGRGGRGGGRPSSSKVSSCSISSAEDCPSLFLLFLSPPLFMMDPEMLAEVWLGGVLDRDWACDCTGDISPRRKSHLGYPDALRKCLPYGLTTLCKRVRLLRYQSSYAAYANLCGLYSYA